MYNMIKKFDICLMNPPYEKTLALKFLENVNNICNIVVSVQPSVFLNKQKLNAPLGKYRKIFNGRVESIDIINHRESNDLFGLGNSIEKLGIFKLSDNSKIDLENYGLTEKEKQLFSKIDLNNHTEIITFAKCQSNHKFGWMNKKTDPLQRQQFDCPVYSWHGGNNCYEAVIIPKEKQQKKISFILIFNSDKEVENFKESLKTQFMDWYYWNFVVPGDHKIMNYMFRFKDYSTKKTNKDFYELFNFNDDEIKIIENFDIKKAKQEYYENKSSKT